MSGKPQIFNLVTEVSDSLILMIEELVDAPSSFAKGLELTMLQVHCFSPVFHEEHPPLCHESKPPSLAYTSLLPVMFSKLTYNHTRGHTHHTWTTTPHRRLQEAFVLMLTSVFTGLYRPPPVLGPHLSSV